MKAILPGQITLRTSKVSQTILLTDNRVKETKLAYKISKLPSKSLETFVFTDDLKNYWDYLQNESKLIAYLFLLKCFECKTIDDFNDLNKSEMLLYKLVDSACERYKSIYKLIKYSFPKIKKKLVGCPKTSEDLFLSIVEWERNNSFEQVVNNNYLEINVNDIKTYSRQLNKFNKCANKDLIPLAQIKKVRNAKPKYLKNINGDPWVEILSIINSIDDSKVRFLGKNYNNSVDFLLENLQKCCDLKNKNRRRPFKSIIWNEGIVKYMSDN